MMDAWLNVYAYCRLRTGSAGLLPSLGNPPISHALMASTRPHSSPLMDSIKVTDLHRNCRQRINLRHDASNPHSEITTTELISPRPRAFLP
jgi:hypothetical protein